MADFAELTRRPAAMSPLLLVSVLAIATCGLVYELIAGTLASYLLGDSVTQFSTVIGVYLFAMGIGSFLSGRIERDLLLLFVRTEILIGLVGGGSAALLFLLFGQVNSFRIPLYGTVGVIGVLVGVEIPLLLRILKDSYQFKDLVARVFAFDYVGALFASLLFPLVLVPHLGLIRSSFLFGMLNVGVALWLLYAIDGPRWVRVHRGIALASLAALLAGFLYADRIMDLSEAAVYPDPVIHAQSTPYQRIVLTASRRDVRLFLNGNLQFSSKDEYRYHEALVHPVLTAVERPAHVLLFGGGDGLAAREVLKVPAVETITQVELDPAMVKLFSGNPMLAAMNDGAFASPKLHVVIQDAFVWLKEQADRPDRPRFDAVIVDFPDPSNYAIGKLYSVTFFRMLRQVLAPGGAIVVQSTSPYVARRSYWCIVETLEAAGLETLPYHAYVPSFGAWGFVLAGRDRPGPKDRYPSGMRYISADTFRTMLYFPPDMARIPADVNRLDSQALVRYFDAEWAEDRRELMRRRTALIAAAAAGLTTGGWHLLGEPDAVPGRLMGAGAGLGHRLRDGGLPEPSATSRADVVVVGGGIAGLSAAWRLRRRGIEDIALLELEAEVGGNAASGRNAVSAYPWGAHYVPLLTREAEHARALFEEIGVITGRTASGEPVYDDLYLCADPHERLYLLGRWQDDLLPQLGATDDDRRQYGAFFAALERFRTASGSDGRRAFAIPVDLSSADPAYRTLDRVSMSAWMAAQGWASKPLLWYVDYCCRDDFGAHAADVSAWAGIHYFAARDSRGQDDQPVLTWPQGNGFLVQQLERLVGPCTTSALAWRVRPSGAGVRVDLYDPATDTSRRIEARAAILATPRFVADRLLGRATDPGRSYAPWMVANVTLDRMPAGRGVPLAWDNVVYDSPSLGYVVATHQRLERVRRETVLTYYWPLCDQPPDEARRAAYETSLAAWQGLVLGELLRVHPELRGFVRNVDVWVWGHGMVRPTPGSIWGPARRAACTQSPPVFFAHSDMSGLSLFEEANYRGVLAADAVAGFLRA